jgi:AcrR family transcriptional regulator
MVDKKTNKSAFSIDLVPKKRLSTARQNPSSPPGIILKAAEDIFAENGYNGTTTREIAKKAGVNIANIHYHWGSKEELWHAVVYNVIMQIMESSQKILDIQSNSIEEGLKNTIGTIIDILADNPNYARILQHSSIRGYSEEIAKDINISLLEIGRFFIKTNFKNPGFDPDLLLFGLTGAFSIFFLEKDAIRVIFNENPSSLSPGFRQKLKDTLFFIVTRVLGLN